MRSFKVKNPPKFVMPPELEPYRKFLADYGLGVEDLMNDHDSDTFNNAYRALVIVGMKEQIGLLTRLIDAGVIGKKPKREKEGLAWALDTVWKHLHRLDPVLTTELYQETPALQDALQGARELLYPAPVTE